MSQLNYMIVDGVLGDYVQEVSEFIDQLEQKSGEGSLEAYTGELMASENPENQEKTFQAIADHAKSLSLAPEKEFESAYNLVLHILTFSSQLRTLLPGVLSGLTDNVPQTPSGPASVLAVLANLFNILPPTSPLREDVFRVVIKFAQDTNQLISVAPQLKRLPQWIKEWGTDEKAAAELYSLVSDALENFGDEDAAYSALKDAVAAGATGELAARFAKASLVSDKVYELDAILDMPAVASLKSSHADIVSDLEATSKGDYKSVKDSAAQRKARVIALAALAGTKATVKYSEIASALEVPEESVELWVIDAIRAGVVEGRLSQMDKEFYVHRAVPVGKVGPEQWKEVSDRLDRWKVALKDVYDVLKNARETSEREQARIRQDA